MPSFKDTEYDLFSLSLDIELIFNEAFVSVKLLLSRIRYCKIFVNKIKSNEEKYLGCFYVRNH